MHLQGPGLATDRDSNALLLGPPLRALHVIAAAKQQRSEELLRQKREEEARLDRLRAKGFSGVPHEAYSPGDCAKG
jgi:hypothetical protein